MRITIGLFKSKVILYPISILVHIRAATAQTCVPIVTYLPSVCLKEEKLLINSFQGSANSSYY